MPVQASIFSRAGWLLPILLVALLSACDLGTLPPGVPSSEALKFTYLCADSFQISNSFQRSGDGLPVRVTATWNQPGQGQRALSRQVKVPWGQDNHPGILRFSLAIPTTVEVRVTATAQTVAMIPSVTITNRGGTECSATTDPNSPRVRIHQGIGFDVAGSISPSLDSVTAGTMISWSFAPTGEATVAEVRINGQLVAPSGSIAVNDDITITAVGLAATPPPPALVPLIEEARAVASSANPRSAYGNLLQHLIDLLDGTDQQTGEAYLNAFKENLSSDEDIERFMALDSILGASLFPITLPTSGAQLHDSPLEDEASGAEPLTWFLAAGILTPQEKLVATARVFRSLLGEQGLTSPTDIFRSFVSPSMTGLSAAARKCAARTIGPVNIRARVNNFLNSCVVIYSPLLDGFDFAEAASQILRQWVGGIPARNISTMLTDSVMHQREMGRHVLINAHSQGTLTSREMTDIAASRRSYRPDVDSPCLGIVAMAGPTSGDWFVSGGLTPIEFAAQGDLVADLGGSTAERIPTDLIRQRDSALATIPRTQNLTRAALALVYALKLHDLEEVYLSQPPLQNRLVSANRFLRNECEVDHLEWTMEPNKRIYQGEAFSAGLYFSPLNRNGRQLRNRRVNLISANPTGVLSITNYFTVLGGGTGAALLTAQAERSRAKASTTIMVAKPPILGIGGSYSGRWFIPGLPEHGGISLSIKELGTSSRDGELEITGTVEYDYLDRGSFSVNYGGTMVVGNEGSEVRIRFIKSTPEYTSPGSWGVVTLTLNPGSGTLSGGENFYFYTGMPRGESRAWQLFRNQ